MLENAISVGRAGTTVTTATNSSNAIAIPVNSSGAVPNYVYAVATATPGGYIQLGNAAAVAGYQIVNVGGAKTGGSATGLANDATAYTANITVDGTLKSISVVGSASQTFTTLINEINTDLGASATASLSGGNILVTSATTNSSSTVAIVDTGANHIFSTLTGYVAILTAVDGTGAIATSSGILITTTPVIIKTAGFSHFSHIWETSAIKINITPLEN